MNTAKDRTDINEIIECIQRAESLRFHDGTKSPMVDHQQRESQNRSRKL